MQTIRVRITGTTKLILHNVELANPMSEIAKEIKRYTSKKAKKDEDHEEIARLEWRGSLYFDREGNVGVPESFFYRAAVEAARKTKRGKDVERALIPKDQNLSLSYDGPKKIEKLYADARFVDNRMMTVQGRKVLRTRPKFEDWSVEMDLRFSDDADPDLIIDSITKAGTEIGVGDYRQRGGGRFTVEVA